jgi:UrcA family protein
MKKSSIRLTFGLFALLSLTSVVATASNSDASVPTYKVNFDDLDLSTAAGNERLYRRIRTAAESVCRTSEGRRLADIARHKSCMEDAVADAVAKIDKPTLTASYRAHHGGQLPLSVSRSAGLNTTKTPVSIH